jgi:heat induced stress protein YflT
MVRSIAGLFPDRASAEQAIVDLKNAGFDPAKIGIVLRDKSEARDVAGAQGTRSTEGAVAGGLIGGSLGAILVAVGALAIPGVGPVISGGVLATLVGGTAGWLVGGLAGLGIPEDEARFYQDQVGQGRALVTVDPDDRAEQARTILIRDGAQNLQGDVNPATADMRAGREAPAPAAAGRRGDDRVVSGKYPPDIDLETDAAPDTGYATERDQIESRGSATSDR